MSDSASLDTDSNFQPIHQEYDLTDLPVIGELPRGLDGTLFRNGPNPQFMPLDPARHHWFAGDGMIHAFRLRDGRASYRNRWVRTDKWRAENAAGHSLPPAFAGPPDPDASPADTGVANTSIVFHAGRLLALEEAHLPFELDPATLATRGVQNFAGALRGPFTAHPKIDPITGEMVFFGYASGGEHLTGMTYGTITPAGEVPASTHSKPPTAAWCTTSRSPTGTCCSRSFRSASAWNAPNPARCPTPGTPTSAAISE